MTIGIANDHHGYELKQKLTKYLSDNKYNVIDYGTNSLVNVDYTDYALKIGMAINNMNIDFGLVICGNGIGMSIACNKIRGLRCAKINSKDDARLARSDVDANVMALSGTIDFSMAKEFVDIFLNTKFLSVDRYIRRLEKLRKIEEANL